MNLPKPIRMITTTRRALRASRKLSTIGRVRKKRVVMLTVGAIIFLTCSIGLAVPHSSMGLWIQPQATLGSTKPAPGDSSEASQKDHRHREHLPQWFRDHQNLSPEAQEQALRNEPGFNRLSAQEQDRLFRRLRQLDAMSPERRERTLQWMEALEKLSPPQRQQVRLIVHTIRQMPRPRRRMMRQAFRNLSQLPAAQRQATLNSPQYESQFSAEERQMLRTLMIVQPYLPQPAPGAGKR